MTTVSKHSKTQLLASKHKVHELISARSYCKYPHTLVLKIIASANLMQAAQRERSLSTSLTSY